MRKRLRNLLVIAALVAAAGLLLRETILGAMGTYLVDSSPPEKADIVLVLAGDGYGNRITTAAELVRKGFAPKILVSGPSGNYGLYECDLAIPYAVKRGYPESYFVHAENDAHSTVEEAQSMLSYFRRENAHHVLLVTSDYHTRRAGGIFRAAAPGLKFTVVGAPGSEFTAHGWWRNRQGQKIAFNEWTKTVTSWFGI